MYSFFRNGGWVVGTGIYVADVEAQIQSVKRKFQTSGNVQVVATATEPMTATISEIAANAEMGSSIAGTALEQAPLTSARVHELGNAVKQIGRVTDVIAEISEQTNLLALNATIEAARAGHAGKGFAIVAGEIKELARQTAEATRELGGQISDIQNKTGDTVARITEISQVIEDLNQIVLSVASAMEEQSVATREIAGSVIMAAHGIEEVNKNVGDTTATSRAIAGDMSEISRSAHEITAGSAQVNGNAQTLSALATQLSQMMGKFTFCTQG